MWACLTEHRKSKFGAIVDKVALISLSIVLKRFSFFFCLIVVKVETLNSHT